MQQDGKPRYAVHEFEIRGMWIEVDGKMVDAVELILNVPSASRPGQANPVRFVLRQEVARAMAAALTRAAEEKGESGDHEPPAQLQ